jgi:hypothetical protein
VGFFTPNEDFLKREGKVASKSLFGVFVVCDVFRKTLVQFVSYRKGRKQKRKRLA